jgi:hypothetical protein
VTPNHLGLSSLTLSNVGVGYNGAAQAGSQDNGQAENLAQVQILSLLNFGRNFFRAHHYF